MAKKARPPEVFWALFDRYGKFFDVYATKEAASEDAHGPRFRPHFTVRAYKLVLRKDEGDL